MIDETNDIEIVVYCRGNSIDKIVINGKEDYFIYMKSQIEASKYQLIPTTEFEVQSPEIQNLRENLWDSKQAAELSPDGALSHGYREGDQRCGRIDRTAYGTF